MRGGVGEGGRQNEGLAGWVVKDEYAGLGGVKYRDGVLGVAGSIYLSVYLYCRPLYRKV